MEQSGEYRIAAGLNEVWRGLNDPDVLARCIDGCQSMEKQSDDQFAAAVKAKIGPVSANFQVALELLDVIAPDVGASAGPTASTDAASYTINANVKGGAAGFGKGTAAVALQPDADATLLRYEVKANVGGKLAQVGSRLIDAAARKMADDFFAAFGEEVSGQTPVATGDNARRGEGSARGSRYESSGRWLIWAIMFGALIVAMVLAI